MDGIHLSQFLSKSIILLLLAFSFSGQSFAAVTYLSDGRQVQIGGDDPISSGSNGVFTPVSPYADFNHANQTSSLTSTGFSANGSGYAYSELYYSFTESLFDISFSLTTESTLSLTGYLYGLDEINGSGDASISLYSGTTNSPGNLLFNSSVAAADYDGFEQEAFIDFSDILAVGDYRIIAIANPYFQTAQSYYSLQAAFTPTAVPVPAAAWLFGSGLLGLIGVAIRRPVAA